MNKGDKEVMAGEPYNPTQQPVCTCGYPLGVGYYHGDCKKTTDQNLDRITELLGVIRNILEQSFQRQVDIINQLDANNDVLDLILVKLEEINQKPIVPQVYNPAWPYPPTTPSDQVGWPIAPGPYCGEARELIHPVLQPTQFTPE